MQAWLTSSLQRLFPLGQPARHSRLALLAARGERISFQVGFRHEGPEPAEVSASAQATGGLRARVRRVGCVPVPRYNTGTPIAERDGVGAIPGYVPDPLFPDTTARFSAEDVH